MESGRRLRLKSMMRELGFFSYAILISYSDNFAKERKTTRKTYTIAFLSTSVGDKTNPSLGR